MTDLEKAHSRLDKIEDDLKSLSTRIIEVSRINATTIISYSSLFTEDKVAEAQQFIAKHGETA